MENLKKKRLFPSNPCKDDLPISESATKVATSNFIHLRKRISSISVPLTTTAWGFRKSRSMPSLGEFSGGPLRRWWEWSWGWLLARKPAFAKDIEMSEEEIYMPGGSLRHVFYKVRSELRKLVRSETLPTTHKLGYGSFGYAQNFDYGAK